MKKTEGMCSGKFTVLIEADPREIWKGPRMEYGDYCEKINEMLPIWVYKEQNNAEITLGSTNKIEVIKVVRTATGCDLRTAKEFVDTAIQEDFNLVIKYFDPFKK